jgi:hypothetical protein
MGLTWKDGVTTVAMAAVAAVYVAFLNGTSLWLISSARGATLAVLVLGIIGGCSFGAVGDLYAEPQPSPAARAWRVIAALCGVAAFAAALAGLASGSAAALAVLVAATGALWLGATVRHAVMAPPVPRRNRDTHEVIHSERAARN